MASIIPWTLVTPNTGPTVSSAATSAADACRVTFTVPSMPVCAM